VPQRHGIAADNRQCCVDEQLGQRAASRFDERARLDSYIFAETRSRLRSKARATVAVTALR